MVVSPIWVIDSDEVFEARIACPGVAASSSENTACLTSMRSGTASTTKSTSPKPDRSVAGAMSAIRAETPSASSLPASRRACHSRRASSIPVCTSSGERSRNTTGMPASAMVNAI